jgi:uncharacterized Zn finger protein (UPF0148 family)
MPNPAPKVITTVEPEQCPMCGSPLVSIGTKDRICNACGFSCTVHTEEDELDAEAERLVRSRGWNEDEGRSKEIGRFQTRW